MKYIDMENIRLVMKETSIPEISPTQVLIKISYAGVNRADIFQREGLYKAPAGSNPVLGLEVSGVVEKLGSAVKTFKLGDKVCAILEGGAYAEYAAVEESSVLPIPQNLNFQQAASLPEALFTCWQAIFIKAAAKKGERILIHGGASGVGHIAIQLAKNFGMQVFTTVRSKEKCDFVKTLGADTAINYQTEDFVEVVKSSGGVDIILDMVGGDYIQKNLKALNVGGRMVIIAFLKGAEEKVNFGALLMKDLSIFSFRMRATPKEVKQQIKTELLQKVWPLIEQKKLMPHVDSEFTLEEVEKAHTRMQAGEHMGKILLKVS